MTSIESLLLNPHCHPHFTQVRIRFVEVQRNAQVGWARAARLSVGICDRALRLPWAIAEDT
ncbi:hypothetical protein LC612_13045 [Nostoc sp. CHAB 5834]|nr:hypothetical protein [Nostoc sp. CHAB 5834]